MANEEISEETQEKVPKKKKSKKLLIIIIIVVLLIVVISGIFIVLFTGGNKKTKQDGKHNISNTQQIKSAKKSVSKFGTPISLAQVGVLYPLDTFIVNLVGNNKQRYLKTQMSLELSNKDLATELDAKKAVIRDRIIGVLSSKTYQQISTIKGKNQLAQQIASTLNPMLSDGTVGGVFFTEFVVQ